MLFQSRSATPPTIELLQSVFGPKTGASAPLWIEGVLNFGAFGDLISMLIAAGLWGVLLRRATSSRRRLGRAIASLGPVWILFAYQALSRVLAIAAIEIFVSVALGVLIWNWTQAQKSVTSSAAMPQVSRPRYQSQSATARFQLPWSSEP